MLRREFLGGCIGFGACASLCLPASAQPLRPIQVGLTPVFLTNDLDLLGHLQAYLSRAWGRDVQLITRRTYQEITGLLIAGEVDAAWICGYPYVQHRAELELLAVPLWQGKPLYRSYVIVDASRDARAFDELAGDVHAFSDPDSNSGFLVTRDLLADRGVRPETFFRHFFYTYGHRNVVRAVASGLAQSGSVDGYVWEVLHEVEPDLTARTRVLRRSELLGFPPIASAKARSGQLSHAELSKAFTAMSEDPEGRSVLNALRLDGFAAEDPSLFDTIAAKVDHVRRVVAQTQQRHFQELTAAYLDGLSSSLIPPVLRDDVWETFDILDRARNLYQGLKITGTVVTNGNGLVLAATDPRSTPSYSSVPTTVTGRFAANENLWLDDVGKEAAARRSLVYNGLNIGTIYAQFDVSGLFRERRDVWSPARSSGAAAYGGQGYGSRILPPAGSILRRPRIRAAPCLM